MREHFKLLQQQLRSDLEKAREIHHGPEQGRYTERALSALLEERLPSRYCVTTGKVVDLDGRESYQTDIIFRDRHEDPVLKITPTWDIVPIESVYGVVSVKSTLNLRTLRDAQKQIASVRRLRRRAACYFTDFERDVDVLQSKPMKRVAKDDVPIRPRAWIFGYRSGWKTSKGFAEALERIMASEDDDLRPNGVCVLDLAYASRVPYCNHWNIHSEHPLLGFFSALVTHLRSFPKYSVDYEKYLRFHPD